MIRLILFAVLAATLFYYFSPEAEVRLGSGVMVQDAPLQINIDSPQSWEKDGYTITPLAKFALQAKVLGKESYSLGRESDLSEYDLNLGWQEFSDEQILDQFEIDQSNRWWHWKTKGNYFPISEDRIYASASNMHIIAANENVESALTRVRKGNIVEMSGYLIEAQAKDGWRWKSSLSRNDRGDGSCEIFWVENLYISK
jgi:hypothetical protein